MKLESIFLGGLLAICAVSLHSCDKTKSHVDDTVNKIEEATRNMKSAKSTSAIEDYYNDVEEAIHDLQGYYEEEGKKPTAEVKNKIQGLCIKADKEYSRAYERVTGEYVEP